MPQLWFTQLRRAESINPPRRDASRSQPRWSGSEAKRDHIVLARVCPSLASAAFEWRTVTLNIGHILKSKARGVATAQPQDSIQDIATRLAQRKIGAVVIVGDNGKVAGIISERDIIRLLAEHGGDALAMRAEEGMTREVVSCSRSSTLDEIMEAMTNGRFRHLPVIEDGGLVGIISIGDVVKHHTAEVELEVTAMRGYLATG